MLTQLTIFLYIVIFLYGIVIGSFLNVLIFRIPKKRISCSPRTVRTAGVSWVGGTWFLYFPI